MPHPAHDGGVDHRSPALRRHFHQVSKAESETPMPLHVKDDDRLIEVTAFDQLTPIFEPGHPTALHPPGRLNMYV
jgi:hypothetical protein